MKTAIIFLCALLPALSGCATMIRGDKQQVAIKTEPGAQLTIDGKPYSEPVDLCLKRNQQHEIIVARDGYQSIEFTLKANWDGLSLLDIPIPGGSALFAADVKNGADRSFNSLQPIRLDKAQSPSTRPVKLYEWRGKLMPEGEYQRARQADRDDHLHLFEPAGEAGLDTGDSTK